MSHWIILFILTLLCIVLSPGGIAPCDENWNSQLSKALVPASQTQASVTSEDSELNLRWQNIDNRFSIGPDGVWLLVLSTDVDFMAGREWLWDPIHHSCWTIVNCQTQSSGVSSLPLAQLSFICRTRSISYSCKLRHTSYNQLRIPGNYICVQLYLNKYYMYIYE